MAQGAFNVADGLYLREYLVEYASGLNVFFVGRLVLAADEFPAVVALLELRLVSECGDVYVKRFHRLQKNVPAALSRLVRKGGGLQFALSVAERHVAFCIGGTGQRAAFQCEFWQYLLNQCRPRSRGFAASADEEVAACPRKSDIKQVQIVDGVLQVFLVVVFFIDRPFHLLLAVVNGYYRHGVERCFRRLAPKDVGMFHAPVAERDDYAVVFQSLAFVD